MVERVQRRASKITTKTEGISYEMRLKECGLATLEIKMWRGDQIEVCLILNGYENMIENIVVSR